MIVTKDQAQDKVNRKLDSILYKKTKRKPLIEESWDELTQRGANLAEQMEWINFRRKQKAKNDNTY